MTERQPDQPPPPQPQRIYFSLLDRVGAQGPYQQHMLLILLLIGVMHMCSFYMLPFLFYLEPYHCPDDISNCSEHVCSLPSSERAAYQPSSTLGLTTLASELEDPRCAGKSDIKSMEELLMLGTSLGLVFGMLFTQCLGRKGSILVAEGFVIVGILMIVIFSSVVMKSVGLFLWGMGSEVAFSIIFNISTEQTHQSIRKKYHTYLVVVFSVGSLGNAGLYALFKHWRVVLLVFYLLGNVAGFVLYLLLIEPTPIELISKCTAEEALNSFTAIAKRNNITDHGLTLEEIAEIQEEYRKNDEQKHNSQYSFLDVLRYASVRRDFFVIGFLNMIILFNLMGPSLLLSNFNFNIYALALINGASSLLCLPIIFATIDSQPRRTTMVIMFACTAIFAVVLVFVNPKQNSGNASQNMLFLVMFFMFRFCANLMAKFYTCCWNEAFPAQIRHIAIYGQAVLASLSRVPIPYLGDLKNSLHIPFMLIFAVTLVVGTALSFLIRETLGIPPREMIEELEIKEHHYQYHRMAQERDLNQ